MDCTQAPVISCSYRSEYGPAKKLRRKGLGDFDALRIDRLRRFKDDVYKEVIKQSKSRYYKGPQNPKERMARYVEVQDFDIPRLTRDMIKRYPKIPKREIRSFVPFSVFVNHLL